ncbi:MULTISPECIES: hypothetical protein [Hymenobacter]|uniref:DUF3313 domain-containing protein n=1 Tax=Hymenobacter profundi TaxID=1982110 RepID=A0ABS6X723_9BACT|nr:MULTISPECIES: hypothetical protein [Hymenobacter]MBW3130769.1 hypothetical protein [Hymenobacter profundi]QNE40872.1 hypothetical protein F1C16_15530 [Hymenobacter sp. NBH84]
MSKLYILLLSSLLLSGCGARTYATRDVNQPVLATHRTVAILPFEVELDRLRTQDILYHGTSDPTPEQIAQRQQQWTESQRQAREALAYELQRCLHNQVQTMRGQGSRSVAFQPVRETNQRLRAAGITYDNLFEHSMTELQQALGVDAVLSGAATLYQPMPNGVAVAAHLLSNTPLLLGGPLTGNVTTANLTVHDCRSGEMVWRFNYERTGSTTVPTADALVKQLLRPAAKTFPYR